MDYILSGARKPDAAVPSPIWPDEGVNTSKAVRVCIIDTVLPQTDKPFVDQVPRLLAERGWSIRKLAAEAGIDPSYLWKVLRRRGYKTAGARVAERTAVALGLPVDYFPEYREKIVIERIKADPAIRDDLYDRMIGER